MTDQQFQLFIWGLLDSRICLLSDDCKAAGPMVAPRQNPGRDEQVKLWLYLSGKVYINNACFGRYRWGGKAVVVRRR
jgi:hypothetical protein